MGQRVRGVSLLLLAASALGCASFEGAEVAEGRPADGGGQLDGSVDGITWSVDGSGTQDAAAGDRSACGKATFALSETQEQVKIPANVSFMHVKAWGAGGNGEGQCPVQDAGIGGYSEAVFNVVPGAELVVIVGKRGRAGMSGEELIKFGFGQWGGGGLSGVFVGSDPITNTSQDRALIIAGGGGGASAPGCHPGGTGNHPKAGGQSTMQGGTGKDDVNSGGGGYEGGAGGAHLVGGKGGTGYVDEKVALVGWKVSYVEPQSPNPPKSDDPDYDGVAGTVEANGLVVIHFLCEPPVVR